MNRLLLLPLMAALVACGHGGTGSRYDDQIRKQVDSVVYADRSVEALQGVLQAPSKNAVYDKIESLNADDISDTSTTNKFVTQTDKDAWD